MGSPENAEKCRNSNSSLDGELLGSPRFQRRQPVKRCPPGKKTLREIALEQKLGNEHVQSLAHASSAPSLLDLFAGSIDKELQNSKSSSDINSNTNVPLLAQDGCNESRTDSPDPFLELISQRHKPQQSMGPQNGSAWVAKFE